MSSEKVWVNGEYIDKANAIVNINLGALHYGTAVFEGISCVGKKGKNAIFRLREHLVRLLESAGLLGLKVHYSIEQLSGAIIGLVKMNNYNSCYIRPVIFSNADYLHLTPDDNRITVAILCEPFYFYQFLLHMRRKIKVGISYAAVVQHDERLLKAKLSGRYLQNALAFAEARKSRFDDAVLLNTAREVTETTAANIFVIQNGAIKLPMRRNTINGIVQDSIIRIAEDIGYCVTEEKISLNALHNADEIFLTSTAKGIVTVGQVGPKKIEDVSDFSIADKLRKIYVDIITGRSSRYNHWLTYI